MYILQGKGIIYFGKQIIHQPNKPIYKFELSTFLFYVKKYIFQIDFNVSNKFIKREALIRALNYISNNIFLYINIFEKGILNYFLFRASISFFLRKRADII